MIFKVGDKLPSVDLFENTPADMVNLAETTAQKKIIVFGVPGAFTPGCSKVRKKNLFFSNSNNYSSF